jgi:hypothetical protein
VARGLPDFPGCPRPTFAGDNPFPSGKALPNQALRVPLVAPGGDWLFELADGQFLARYPAGLTYEAIVAAA